MENKNTIIGFAILAIFSAIVLFLGLTGLNPRTTHWLGLIFITVALFLFFWGLLGTVLLAHRAWRKKNRRAAASLRQASFFSIAITLALYLARFNLLTWLNIIVLVGIIVLLEIFFMGKEETV